MDVIYQVRSEYDKKYSSKKVSCLNYMSKKTMKKVYPEMGYTVIGAIGDGVKNKIDHLIVEDKKLRYFTLKYNKWFYGIDGYIDCGNDEYIAVVKNKLLMRLILFFLSLAVLLGLFFAGLQWSGDKLGLDPNAGDYKPPIELPSNSDPNKISIPGYQKIVMEADTDIIYMALWNPDTNPCYFKFTIETEDGEVLYQSGLVPPGKAITEVKLKKKISEGEHSVLVRMDTYSLEDGKTPMNGGNSKATIESVKK